MSTEEDDGKPPLVLAGPLGDCVHVAGVTRFLGEAESLGYRTYFTGPATDAESFVEAAVTLRPEVIGVSYRLTPGNAEVALAELVEMLKAAGLGDRRLMFGGTPPVAAVARRMGVFEAVFEGGESADVIRAALRGEGTGGEERPIPPQQAVERILWKAPTPILRHHYGEPALTIEPTLRGVGRIAESGLLDVISLGADQDAQENFFRPHLQDPKSKGAGGVPLRTPEDLQRLYEASRRGNFPLMRSYSGTADHIRYADLLLGTIKNAWCATSLFWFNAMDGRGHSPLAQSIREHVELMLWHGGRGVPVEGNEPYHWGMRDAHDVVVCAASYIYAHVAKKAGVRDYIATYMFESPPHLSPAMDLAKALAQIELAESLADDDFRVWRQTRTGLLGYPLDTNRARAHLAVSITFQMALKPHVVHVVGYTEADHAATAEEVVESARMAAYAVEVALRGAPDPTFDPRVQERKAELLEETRVLLDAIRSLAPGHEDPLSDPDTLALAVKVGLLDAPQLAGSRFAAGAVRTRGIGGAIRAVDAHGSPISEKERTGIILHLL